MRAEQTPRNEGPKYFEHTTILYSLQNASFRTVHTKPNQPFTPPTVYSQHECRALIDISDRTHNALMLRGDFLASQLLDIVFGTVTEISVSSSRSMKDKRNSHITQSYHANRLPNTKPNPRSNAAIQPLDPICLVNVPERAAHRHLLRTIRILCLTLHLHAHNLNRLVPGTKPTAHRRRGNLLHNAQLLAMLLASGPPDARLSKSAEPEARPPVRDLAYRDGVDAFVDASDPLGSVDGHERLHRAGHLLARRRGLVLRDLDRLHARAEAHRGVGLRETAGHAARDAADEGGRAERLSIILGFGGDEEEDCALGAGFDPGPWDETLVDCS